MGDNETEYFQKKYYLLTKLNDQAHKTVSPDALSTECTFLHQLSKPNTGAQEASTEKIGLYRLGEEGTCDRIHNGSLQMQETGLHEEGLIELFANF